MKIKLTGEGAGPTPGRFSRQKEVNTVARNAFLGSPSASSAFLIFRLSRMPSWRSAVPGHPQDPLRWEFSTQQNRSHGDHPLTMKMGRNFFRNLGTVLVFEIFEAGYRSEPADLTDGSRLFERVS